MPGYSFETYGELQPWLGREWLQTNGTGAFAASTVLGANARRYHGLLVGATLPPLGRVVALNRVSESIQRDGRTTAELSVNHFHGGIAPHGEGHLRRFEHYATTRWVYDADGVSVTKDVLLCWGRNIVGIKYEIYPGVSGPILFRAQPFVTLRDFHGLQRADHHLDVCPAKNGCDVRRWGHTLRLRCDGPRFVEYKDWWYNFNYPFETDRGQDDTEDLFTPGHFAIDIEGPTTFVIWAGLDAVDGLDWAAEEKKRLDNTADGVAPTRVQKRLFHAAADFLAMRHDEGRQGATVIAGFPWFADWGRDTMVGLPGLLLCTGQFDKAGQVLSTFAGYVSEGMIPNNFDDYSNQPTYNAADASLWFIHAAFEYLKKSHDQDTFDSILRPACQQIIDGYKHGTRFGIKMDGDGLIKQGDPTTQLTWMDAKTNGVVFTPRHGKAVEINALWYHALKLMGDESLAATVAENFRRTFWINTARGLADVSNETGRDDSCRPNQIFAVSLPHSPLTDEQQRTVVDVVRRELLTPFGLRTLSAGDPKYQPRYSGSQFERDRSYHNGAIWPWLIGAFLDAHLKVNGRQGYSRDQARRWLSPLIDSLEDGCVGSISEIYEAQPPHRAVGCFAQAWSVAEVLRLAIELEM
ncbi:MAG TPA: amylo-alpha-1,6-glucosidase [Tepidisphaeraceae bacterium]|jgi:predicted glycogen debranching enzyme